MTSSTEQRANLEKYRDERTGKIQVGLCAAYELLEWLRDPLGLHFAATRDALMGFIEARNRSLLAHGITPVRKADWQRFGESWIAWMEPWCT